MKEKEGSIIIQKALLSVAENPSSRVEESITLEEYFQRLRECPTKYLRSIRQVVSDAILSMIKKERDDQRDPESINFNKIDCSEIFENYIPDTLFANRFVQKMEGLKIGATQNKIYIFQGPPGCGKSTFLDDLLDAITKYTNLENSMYELVWQIKDQQKEGCKEECYTDTTTEVACPSHDHPIMLIPLELRREFLDEILKNNQKKHQIYHNKEYEWIFTDKPCAICESFYIELSKKFGSVKKMMKNVRVRPYQFNRRIGNGITVFGPGDEPLKQFILGNEHLQKKIDNFFGDSAKVQYTYSPFAKTNNGIYALTDVKENNIGRMRKLHNIVSEALLKVGHKEESVNSLIICVVNPEDMNSINDLKSFSDRIEIIKLTYVTDPDVEIQILKNTFGCDIERFFLPNVLDSFAKMIIATRLDTNSEAIKKWIKDGDLDKYRKYTDIDGLLIKMDFYRSRIPTWISEEDRKNLTANIRRMIIKEAEVDGHTGISGRESIKLFKELKNKFKKNDKKINMSDLEKFFTDLETKKQKELKEKSGNERSKVEDSIPNMHFWQDLVYIYNYSITEMIKMALYEYNEEQIDKDILHYLHATNMEMGTEETCPWTGEKIKASIDSFKIIEKKIFGIAHESIRESIQKSYVQITVQEVNLDGKNIKETEQFLRMKQQYISRLKDSSVSSLKDNDNFRNAIANYENTEKFASYDEKIKYSVNLLIKVLTEQHGYDEEGAIEISLYALDNYLFEE